MIFTSTTVTSSPTPSIGLPAVLVRDQRLLLGPRHVDRRNGVLHLEDHLARERRGSDEPEQPLGRRTRRDLRGASRAIGYSWSASTFVATRRNVLEIETAAEDAKAGSGGACMPVDVLTEVVVERPNRRSRRIRLGSRQRAEVVREYQIRRVEDARAGDRRVPHRLRGAIPRATTRVPLTRLWTSSRTRASS